MSTEWNTFVMPRSVDRSVYEAVIDEFVDQVGSQQAVRGILRYGGVSAPGISDIDLIVVLDHRASPRPSDLAYRSKIPEHGYCFSHRAGILPDNMISRLMDLGFYHKLEVIHGNVQLGAEPDRELTFVLTVDGLIDRLLSIVHYLGSPVCDVRTVLVLAYSLKHTLTLCREMGMSISHEIVERTEEFARFRSAWFESPDPTRLRSDVEQLFRMFATLTGALGEFAIAQEWWSRELSERALDVQTSASTRVVAGPLSEIDPSRPYEVVSRGVTVMGKRLEASRSSISIDPRLGPHLLAYVSGSSSLANELRWKVNVPFDANLISPAYLSVVQRRLTTIADHCKFLRRHGFDYGRLHTSALIQMQLPLKNRKTKLIRLAQRILRTTLARP